MSYKDLLKGNNTLSDQEMARFSKLLFLYERELRNNRTGFNLNKIKKFLHEKSIALIYNGNVVEQTKKNTIAFSSSISVCFDFIRHVRNAFAHAQIIKEKNSYILIDIKNGKELTMHGSINKELLPKLIDEMLNTRSAPKE